MPLRDRLIQEEGWKNNTYLDTRNFATWGVGHKDPHSPVGEYHTDAQISAQLDSDISAATGALERNLPWVVTLDPVRLGVLIDMAFQMGVGGLMGFSETLASIKAGNYAAASSEMLQSDWANQTPNRAKGLSQIMLTGIDQ